MQAIARHRRGFTLIELMVTLAVVVVLLLIAVPSFIAFRQRSALAAAGEQVVGVWNQARLEAAKQNTIMKFGVKTSSGNFCIGVGPASSLTDSTPCDCFTANACSVAVFPAQQEQWAGVTLSGTPTLGDDTGVVVIEPKRTSLVDPDGAGAITLNGPPGQYAYKLNFLVDRFGRASLCESTSASARMPAYATRRCSP